MLDVETAWTIRSLTFSSIRQANPWQNLTRWPHTRRLGVDALISQNFLNSLSFLSASKFFPGVDETGLQRDGWE